MFLYLFIKKSLCYRKPLGISAHPSQRPLNLEVSNIIFLKSDNYRYIIYKYFRYYEFDSEI